MGFLTALSKTINNQFGIGDSKSSLAGKMAESTDKTAERYYLEDGFIRNIRPRTKSILFQQPDIYVVIKKRMFSSLVDNSRLDLLEEKERILIAASKKLFQNKCNLISAYEKLTKIEKLTYESDSFNTFLGPTLINLVDLGLFKMDDNGQEKAAIDQLRKVLSYAQPGELTSWTTNDWDAVFSDQIGEGTGTLELTLISNLSTTVSTSWGDGGAELTIEDPYNLMTITEGDIDQALTDVTNPLSSKSFIKFTQIELQNQIDQLKSELSLERYSRGASQITFKINKGTISSKKILAIMDDEGREIIFQYSTGMQNAMEGLENSSNLFEAATSLTNVFSTGSVQIDQQFLDGNDPININENNQLTSSERKKFTEIISNIYTLMDQNTTSQRQLIKNNALVNYARNRMRLFFNGKYIIQPMDEIEIFMTSRTGEDSKMPGGFAKQQAASGMSVSKKFDSIIKGINSGIHSLDPSSLNGRIDFDDVERLATVGPGMPKWLWRQFKSDITGQPTGPCIFKGLAGKGTQGVSGSWNDGKWTIRVTCEDDTGYFDKGQINIKPSADVFNSCIYDPLTPFDVSFDAATGVPLTDASNGDFLPLLPENQKLLMSGLTMFRSGPDKGSPATFEAYQKNTNEISFDQFRRVLHDPEGMVYRWKQGIQTLTKSGRPYPQTSTDHERTILLTNQPFAGQDIMNVISLLVTGQPYNYGTFLKAAIANQNSIGKNDTAFNVPAASTYIQGLLSDIDRTNAVWGNFIPYKTLDSNSSLDKFIAESRLDLVSLNQKLNQKLNERAKIEDELILNTSGQNDIYSSYAINAEGKATRRSDESSFGDQSANTSKQNKINSLSNEIAALQAEFNSSVSGELSLVGSDVNPALSSANDTSSTLAQKQRDEMQMRRNLRKNTARRYWQAKANEDKNLFIVDSQYDKNLDIMAFERKIANKVELFNSQYSNISDQISSVKKLLGLEVFANSQGHIEVRPPAYNKIPSTVFYKMFKDRDEKGVKVFPDFLENLYFNQVRGIFNQIEIIEDEIRLRSVALGARNDEDIVKLVISGGANTGASEDFGLLTKFYGDGRIGTVPLQQLLLQTTPEFSTDSQNQALEELGAYANAISKNLQISQLFTPSIQASAIANFNPNASPDRQTDLIETIRDRLRIKTGREAKTITELFGNDQFRTRTNQSVSQVDKLNILNQLSNLISERQTLMRSAQNAIRNLQEGVAINAPDTQSDPLSQGGLGNMFTTTNSNKTAKTLCSPFLNRKTEIPQFLEHMIEYEEDDDIGPNSGRRFIITADRIVSLTISENPPPFNAISVNGYFAEGFIDPPSAFTTSSDGNAITSAYAVDYDMWYQYGFRMARAIEAPYLSDPDSQCAPYAVATLLEARENILQGSLEVCGYNEYYQPGDVIFIEDKGLLFYVKSVKHSFSYGKLSTTLALCYGHSPGEYIPTMLDVVGKILYNAKGFTGQFRNERFQMLGSARSIGALVIDPTSFETDPLTLLVSGKYGQRNINIMSNILFAASGGLNQVNFSKQKTRIKIVYYKTAISDSNRMYNLTNSIFNWLLYPEQNSPKEGLIPVVSNTSGTAKQKSFGINADDIIIEEVDLTDINKSTRSRKYPQNNNGSVDNKQGPSNSAIAVTRLIDSDSGPDGFKHLLANNVIDIFVDYELVKNKTISQSNGTSQADQANNNSVAVARTENRR